MMIDRVMNVRLKLVFQLVLALGVVFAGCTQPANPTSSGTDSTGTGMVSEEKKALTGPAGSWISSMAPDAAMEVSNKGGAIQIRWVASLDMDIDIDGELAEKGAGIYGGKVTLISGDAGAEKADATVRFDAVGQTLTLELPILWTDTVMFRRAAGAATGCAAAGEQVVERTQIFKDLTQNTSGVGINHETASPDARVQDYQIVHDDGEMFVTLSRMRVDFNKKQVLVYDPAEDTYAPQEGSAALFEGVNCK